MFNLRWLGRILLCLLVGIVMGGLMLGLAPPLPKAPDHLGLDAFHKSYYGRVWTESEMPQDQDPFEMDEGQEALANYDLRYQPKPRARNLSYSEKLQRWKWLIRLESSRLKHQVLIWIHKGRKRWEQWRQKKER